MDMMDEAVFEELDLIEVEASTDGSKALHRASGRSEAHSGDGSSASGPSTNARNRDMEPDPNPDPDIIIIDDEEEDKENIPVPTRHVRRRTVMDIVQVIDISDDEDVS